MKDIPHSKPWILQDDWEAAEDVLRSGMLAQGALVQRFEAAVSQRVGASFGIATASGSAALELALRALGVGPADEVIIPTYVCRSVAAAVLATGATPRLCDVGPDWVMTCESVERQQSLRTAAIVAVHTFGIPCDMAALGQLGPPVVEDACQALGARVDGDWAGAAGEIGVFSFQATKCLTTGEGGMAVTRRADLAERLRQLRDGVPHGGTGHGRVPLSDLAAAIGLAQLRRYEGFLARRRQLAEYYFEQLEQSGLQLPVSVRGRSIFFRFAVRRGGDFDQWRASCAQRGVQVRRGVDQLLHRLLGQPRERFPTAERLFAETISLPIYPALSDAEAAEVAKVCRAVFGAAYHTEEAA